MNLRRTGPCFAGLDGGGSSTRLQLTDASGKLLFEANAGPTNILVVGWEQAKAAFEALWDEVVRLDVDVAAMVAGLAGSDRPEVHSGWVDYFTRLPLQRFWVTGDYQVAWAALGGGGPAVIAIVGTGSVVYASDGIRSVRRGGYGWRFGDVASGVWLGTEAAKSVLAAWEGWGEETALVDLVMRRWNVKQPQELLAYWYGPSFDPHLAANLAADVVSLAESDTVSHRIVTEACQGLTKLMANALAQLHWTGGAIGVSGGLATVLMPWLEREWWSQGHKERLSRSPVEPVVGAAMLARMWSEQRRSADGGAY